MTTTTTTAARVASVREGRMLTQTIVPPGWRAKLL
jgi:hypothetical protein